MEALQTWFPLLRLFFFPVQASESNGTPLWQPWALPKGRSILGNPGNQNPSSQGKRSTKRVGRDFPTLGNHLQNLQGRGMTPLTPGWTLHAPTHPNIWTHRHGAVSSHWAPFPSARKQEHWHYNVWVSFCNEKSLRSWGTRRLVVFLAWNLLKRRASILTPLHHQNKQQLCPQTGLLGLFILLREGHARQPMVPGQMALTYPGRRQPPQMSKYDELSDPPATLLFASLVTSNN